ncbi:mannose-1-phosphate guanyltransferase [Leptotrichia sp. OH3620_COT-345]|uniref:mannose-1-phosphate guanylyltransferase n=1 Tax=Leptotrichia sp. OH3620_COT-345 TaxID=2491048 RepID=UPI000F654A43|nr:mannose-1-phosphate guanylyltransferase [Leptotrichia sp. OH3620_COT-345]RRD38859.1 mannose-1-phosphate guanyltransferase [Leptotrichia sp. OH3620_COT-345]
MDKVVLIMAGGSGTRFWPLSTNERPKQFLDLVSEKTMIRETVDRVAKLIPMEKIFISTNIAYLDIIKKELPEIPEKNIIFEPMARDTAACIGYAALIIQKMYKNSVMSVLPSDHLIKSENEFLESLKFAFEKAESDIIVTLGIKPSYPETGYGYIEYMKNTNKSDRKFKIYKVKSFREKPNRETAEKYIEKGNYLWNSGMFIWKTEFILNEIKKYMETHRNVINKIKKKIDEINIDEVYGEKLSKYIYNEFFEFEKISIDFGVMEHTKLVSVIPVDIGWNDVGSFKSLEDVFSKDENGNIVKSEKYEDIESEGNIIINKEKHKIVATIGLEDIVIVNTEDALLVCSKEKSQEIKKILGKIEKYKK